MLNRKMENDTILFTDGTATVLAVQETMTEQGILMKLSGELRSDVAHDIQDELIALTTVGADVLVDFEQVCYITPTTQHIFLRAQQKMDAMGKGSLTLCNLPDVIYREFEKTGTSELLMILDREGR